MIDFDIPEEWLDQNLEISVQPAIPTERGLMFSTTKGKLKQNLPGALLVAVTAPDGTMADMLMPKATIQHVKLTSALTAPVRKLHSLS